MQLLVIRHAIAKDAAPDQSDESRKLTRSGVKKFKQVVRGMRGLGVSCDRILASPWTRAAHTAQLLRPLCKRVPVTSELLCQSPRSELLSLIAQLGPNTAIVGHEPWLSELVAWLAFGDTRHGDAFVLKKAGVVWLDGRAIPGGMQVHAVVPPKLLRELAS